MRRSRTVARAKVMVLFACLLFAAVPLARARDLSIDERVATQKAIEQVYWNHRIWPKENPGPKPPLSVAIPDATIRAKVEDHLRMSALLDSFWHQPLTGEQLQAEIDRMVRHTKAPETLRELFAALHDDPLLIAECLARPQLAQRRIEAAFAHDERIHGAQRAALESKLNGVEDLAALEVVDGDHSVTTYVLDEGVAEKAPADPMDLAIHLNRDEWDAEIGRFRADFAIGSAGGLSALPVGRVSRLRDRGDRFVVNALRARNATSVTVASVSWAKRTYGEWAREKAATLALDTRVIASPALVYSVPALPLTACVEDDTWTPTAGSEIPDERYGHTVIWTGSEMIVWGGGKTVGFPSAGGRFDPATDSWVASSLSTGSGANVPTGRGYHTAVWTGIEMIVWGGEGVRPRNEPVNTGGRYNPTTDSWVASSLLTGSGAYTPSGRKRHTAIWTGSEMIVWGGNLGGDLMTNTGGRYDPSTDSWAASPLADGSGANVPDARGDHTAVWTGSAMIVWGGRGGAGLATNTGGRYDPSTDSWAASSLSTGSGANIPDARGNHTAVWTGTELIVWGGSDGTGLVTDTGGRYDPSTDSWASSSLTTGSGANVPAARQYHTAVWTGTEMIVWGGSDGSGIRANTGGRYTPGTDSWDASSLTTGSGANVPAARQDHTAVWIGSQMIVWGGSDADGFGMNTGGRYDPSTDSWVNSSLAVGSGANIPIPRQLQTAIWTGAEMIVWGGVDYGHTMQNTGGCYDPATDSWAGSSLTSGTGANVPVGRYDHTAVWTGTEMIVWGGWSHDGATNEENSGGRYNPSTDSWIASSLTSGTGANVPVGRSEHTAVWTGTEMIVWGGWHYDGASNKLNSGGRYNPSTDSWVYSSLTTGSGANVPVGRYDHTAVWTGTEMIVWGGSGGASMNTGGRYDPSTDSWAASRLTTGQGENMPPATDRHTAAWTGTEMIVWGRNAKGGRYNPATDAWVASSLTTGSGANVPSARAGYSAVWTGSEMIIWGGLISSAGSYANLNTGGRYNPATDLWATSSLTTGSGANLPAARDSHSAVWTGSQMVVWGGYPITHSGGLYCACFNPTWYQDLDGDGFGNPAVTLTSCPQPLGYVTLGTDCDDTSPAVNPYAAEMCNGIDDNCDTVTDNEANALCADDNACTYNVCAGVHGCLSTTANLDTTDFSANRVDGRDLDVLANAWNSCPGTPRYILAANLDQVTTLPGACIDGTDFHLFMISFGHSCS